VYNTVESHSSANASASSTKTALKMSRRSDGVVSGGDHFHGFRVPPGGMTTSEK
jgi:hypothetical protein